jgi:hypothetical protein
VCREGVRALRCDEEGRKMVFIPASDGPSCCGVRCDIVPYMYKRYPSLAQLYYNCLLPASWFRMN